MNRTFIFRKRHWRTANEKVSGKMIDRTDENLSMEILREIMDRVTNLLLLARCFGNFSVSLIRVLPKRHGQSLSKGRIYIKGTEGAVVSLIIFVRGFDSKIEIHVRNTDERAPLPPQALAIAFLKLELEDQRTFFQHVYQSKIQSEFKQLELDEYRIVTETGYELAATGDVSMVAQKPSEESREAPEEESDSAQMAQLAFIMFMFSVFMEHEKKEVVVPKKEPEITPESLEKLSLDDLLRLGLQQARIMEMIVAEVRAR